MNLLNMTKQGTNILAIIPSSPKKSVTSGVDTLVAATPRQILL